MPVARLFGLPLVVVFAMSAMPPSSASARYTFHLPITERQFFALSATSVLNNDAATITCTDDLATGFIVNDDEVLAKIHFVNCTVKTGGTGPCPISGINGTVTQPPELILTELLRGLLGLLHLPNDAAGILFAPNTGQKLVTLAAVDAPCDTPETQVEGNVAALVSPVGSRQDTAKFAFNAFGFKSEITLILTLSGAVSVKLLSYGISTAFLSEDSVLFEEAVEVV